MVLISQRRIRTLLALLPVGLATIRAASAVEPADTAVVAPAATAPQNVDKAEIYSVLEDYCRYALANTSNDVARCQLYAHWGRALEGKLRLQEVDFPTIRRAVVQPYLAGFQTATAHQDAGVNDSGFSGNASETNDRKERLAEFRSFFKQKIVALYSQPPIDLKELEYLAGKSVPDKLAVQEVIDADEFKSLRARHH